MMRNSENTSSVTMGLYTKHYKILLTIADRLRSSGPADIDTLLEDTRRAMESYEICRTRLDAVRAELNAQVGRS
jgi:hypothetical protein